MYVKAFTRISEVAIYCVFHVQGFVVCINTWNEFLTSYSQAQEEWIPFQPVNNGNTTRSVLVLNPKPEDDGTVLTCRSQNPLFMPTEALEDSIHLLIHREWHRKITNTDIQTSDLKELNILTITNFITYLLYIFCDMGESNRSDKWFECVIFYEIILQAFKCEIHFILVVEILVVFMQFFYVLTDLIALKY